MDVTVTVTSIVDSREFGDYIKELLELGHEVRVRAMPAKKVKT